MSRRLRRQNVVPVFSEGALHMAWWHRMPGLFLGDAVIAAGVARSASVVVILHVSPREATRRLSTRTARVGKQSQRLIAAGPAAPEWRTARRQYEALLPLTPRLIEIDNTHDDPDGTVEAILDRVDLWGQEHLPTASPACRQRPSVDFEPKGGSQAHALHLAGHGVFELPEFIAECDAGF